MSAGNERFDAEAAAWDANPDVHRASESAAKALLERLPSLQKAAHNGGSSTENRPEILEIGCGTGLLTLRLAPFASRILAVDASRGMTDALSRKLQQPDAPTNVTPLCVMLTDPDDPSLPAASDSVAQKGSDEDDVFVAPNDGADIGPARFTSPRRRFDIIVSHLVLHHIPDLRELLTTMLGCLVPGGRVALTDYEDFGPSARKFHPEAKMGGVERHGIERRWFEGLMREVGLVDVGCEVGWTMAKEVERFPGEWGQKKPSGPGVKNEEMEFPFLVCLGTKPKV